MLAAVSAALARLQRILERRARVTAIISDGADPMKTKAGPSRPGGAEAGFRAFE